MRKLVCLIFSKDRAMQLQATIESFFLHCNDDVEMYVLYKVTSPLHRRQYEYLQNKFPKIYFQEECNFKVQIFRVASQYTYILFLVDDNLFVRNFSIPRIIESLQANQDAIGFSLGLGRNTNYCYPKNAKQNLPAFESVGDGILKYDWPKAEYDFGYPLEICSSVYRTDDIWPLLKQLHFGNPSMLEGMLAANAKGFREFKSQRLCYEQSVAFTNPINIVQTVTSNRAGNKDECSVERLALLFEDGFKINVENYSGFISESCHQEVGLALKLRDKVENVEVSSSV